MVALNYDPRKMAAPVVLATAYDEVAQRIKEIAAEKNIPMVENIALARALAQELRSASGAAELVSGRGGGVNRCV